MCLDMADAHKPPRDPQRFGNAGALPAEMHDRLPAGFVADFDVGPCDPAAPTGAEHFQHRLFGGEPAGQMLEPPLDAAVGIGLFDRREDAIHEPLPMLLKQMPDAGDFNDVDAVTDEGHVDLDAFKKSKARITSMKNPVRNHFRI